MTMSFKRAPFALGLAAALALGAAPAQASFNAGILPTVTPQGGNFLYSYLVTDLATSTSNISEFDLDVSGGQQAMGIITPTGAPLSNITMPTGFINLYTLGDPYISFQSTDPSTDIAPGASATFSFTSPDGPATQAYQFVDLNTGNTMGGTTLSPTPLGAAAVPEPGSLLLVALGIPGLIGLAARRRCRQAS